MRCATYAVIGVRAPPPAALGRPRLSAVLVLDVSRSMTGEPLAQVLRTARRVAEILEDDDRLGVVTFATGVAWRRRRTLRPLSRGPDRSRRRPSPRAVKPRGRHQHRGRAGAGGAALPPARGGGAAAHPPDERRRAHRGPPGAGGAGRHRAPAPVARRRRRHPRVRQEAPRRHPLRDRPGRRGATLLRGRPPARRSGASSGAWAPSSTWWPRASSSCSRRARGSRSCGCWFAPQDHGGRRRAPRGLSEISWRATSATWSWSCAVLSDGASLGARLSGRRAEAAAPSSGRTSRSLPRRRRSRPRSRRPRPVVSVLIAAEMRAHARGLADAARYADAEVELLTAQALGRRHAKLRLRRPGACSPTLSTRPSPTRSE